MNIFFDIETIPSQSAEVRAELAAAVTAPGQYKKPESIAEWLRDNREAEAEAAWLKTSFDGGAGQVVCIGWAVDDGDVNCLHVPSLSRADEMALLANWFADLTKLHSTGGTRPVLIGHNSNAFDIPFLWKRAMVLGVKPPLWFPRDPKPWGESTRDTMLMWDSQQRAGGSMARLCRIFGIEGKGDIDGSMVWPMVQAGKIAEVAEYCRGDVERTRALYRRMTFEIPAPTADATLKAAILARSPALAASLPASIFG